MTDRKFGDLLDQCLAQFMAMPEAAQRAFLGSDCPDEPPEPDGDVTVYRITPKGEARLRREAILAARRGAGVVPPWRGERRVEE